ncbi:MAG: hypothetical protein LBG60_00440 [Bifidobacteriaceae bacterium]|jgi:hypothetical protein|nr:hypothetical protein [Bifidobacteriaceae bacterium]
MTAKRKQPERADGIGQAVQTWLDAKTADELRDLVRRARAQAPGFEQWLTAEAEPFLDAQLVADARLDRLLERIRSELVLPLDPYDDDDGYSWNGPSDAEIDHTLLQEVIDLAKRPSLAAGTALRAAIAELLEAGEEAEYSQDLLFEDAAELAVLHAQLAGRLGPALGPAGRLALAEDLFDLFALPGAEWLGVELTDYREALDGPAWARFRELSDAAGASGEEGAWAAARRELAVLDGDEAAIVAEFGGSLEKQTQFLAAVQALSRAGLAEAAETLARRGFALWRAPGEDGAESFERNWGADADLGEWLAVAARARGDQAAAAELRLEMLRRSPGRERLARLREQAELAGTWDRMAGRAEALLARARPDEWVRELLAQDRNDEAWAFTGAHRPQVSAWTWRQVLEARGRTHPAEVIDHFRALIKPIAGNAGRPAYEEVGGCWFR